MKITPLRLLSISALCLLAVALPVCAQDFQQTYRLGAGGVVNIRSVSGDVKVIGTDGDAIVVTAFKEGRDLDRVTIEDNSTSNRVEVRDRYPENCRNCNVSVRFEVRVPRHISYRYDSFSSVSGDVEVANVTGELKAKSVSGGVVVKGAAGPVNANSVSGHVRVEDVVGTVSAKSVSGHVDVEITRLDGAGDMEFSTVSGSVKVRMPGNLNAEIEMSSMSGDLQTDFPIQIERKEWGPGRSARGRIGNGTQRVKMSSVSGSVHLIRQQ